MKLVKSVVCLLCLTAGMWGAESIERVPGSADDYLRAIRADDLKVLRDLSRSGVREVRDKLDWTPLHYAALYGSTEAVRIVLAAGGDPNARNKSQATPLMYGAYNLDKTRLLVEKGGDVNAKASDGSTPLWVAMDVTGNDLTVRYLIEKGADLKAIYPSGSDYLMRAVVNANTETVRWLLDKGLDPHRIDKAGFNALADSLNCGASEKARLLVAARSDVNAPNTYAGEVKNGPIDLTKLTPFMLAASCNDSETISAMLKAGAKVNALDNRHMTVLMMAVASDQANPEIVRRLIAAGVNLNMADRYGDTALDWARKFRNPEIVALLEKAGARGKGLAAAPVKPADYKPDARTAVDRASGLLAKSSEEFFREGGGCVGCHHQPFAGRAYGALKSAGVAAEPRLRRILIDGLVAERAREMNRLPLLNKGGGGYDSFLYPLAGMADMGEPASELSDVMVHFIAQNQHSSGAWTSFSARPPIQESSFTRTMLAIYALKTYGWPAREAEFKQRIARAREWLRTAKANTTLDEAERLLGLSLAGVTETELRPIAQRLLKAQRADGGWAQTSNLDSDAYGTSAVLYSLRKSGMLKASDAVYQRGVQYLLDTQFPDGSWYVRSRAVKLQPYFQSAFPYDHDQWISNSATGYAVMALAPIVAQ